MTPEQVDRILQAPVPASGRKQRRQGGREFYPIEAEIEDVRLSALSFDFEGGITMVTGDRSKERARFYCLSLWKIQSSNVWRVECYFGKNYPRPMCRRTFEEKASEVAARHFIARKIQLLIELGYYVHGEPTL